MRYKGSSPKTLPNGGGSVENLSKSQRLASAVVMVPIYLDIADTTGSGHPTLPAASGISGTLFHTSPGCPKAHKVMN